ncbi:HNH endonuclease [Flavobacterium sp.]|uniref:HNH endonuclease n=1 Tax=Flavobacterium sp. TaxID=239 RepID=UPI00374D768D
MIKIEYPDKFVEEYYYSIVTKNKNVNEIKLSQTKVTKINKVLKRIKFKGGTLDLEKLITADFDELIELVRLFENEFCNEFKDKVKMKNIGNEQYIDYLFESRLNDNILPVFLSDSKIKTKILNDMKNEWNSILSESNSIVYEVDSIRKKISNFFMSKSDIINLKTCYYCNIDFINSFVSKGENKNHFTLDHFFPKEKFPYLSISLFNLVPCCSPCNTKFKGKKTFKFDKELFSLSPSSKFYQVDNELFFNLYFNISGQNLEEKLKKVISNNDFEIKLENCSKMIGNYSFIDFFKLEGRYDFHKNEALKMINKRKIYSDSQIKELSDLFIQKGIAKDEEAIKKDLFGTSIFNEDEKNEPFAKYKKDIAKQLGLI